MVFTPGSSPASRATPRNSAAPAFTIANAAAAMSSPLPNAYNGTWGSSGLGPSHPDTEALPVL